MNCALTRPSYSVEVQKRQSQALPHILKAGGDVPPSELAGMEFLGRLLGQLENMSDADIAEKVRRRLPICLIGTYS